MKKKKKKNKSRYITDPKKLHNVRKSEALFCDFNSNLSEVTFPKIIASMIYQYGLLNCYQYETGTRPMTC